MNNSKFLILIVLIILISCKDSNVVEDFYKSGNLKTKYFLKDDDTVRIDEFYDDSNNKIYKQVFLNRDFDKVKYFYLNGNTYKQGLINKAGFKKGNWNRYTKEGFLSDTREYFIIDDKSIINRQFYYTKTGDTTWYARRFNSYLQKEFIGDTLKSRNSTMNVFDFYSKDTISLSEPFAAVVRYNSPLARKYNSEIVMYLAKEKSNFNENFSNINEVELDTFPNLKYDKENQLNFPKNTNYQYVAVFGRWFNTTGKKTLRGYVKEYFKKEPSSSDNIIEGEKRLYFEKTIFVKDGNEGNVGDVPK